MDEWNPTELGRLVERRAPSSAALDRLEAAVAVVEELRAVGDEVLDRFVAEARAGGCSWAQVGAALGVSKQAAQQRFPAGGPLGRWAEEVSDGVRAAMVAAQEEARGLGHDYIGTEHLLLALLAQTDGLAAASLAALGVTREELVARTREVISSEAPNQCEPLGMAPRLKRALELARAEARRLGHRRVETEHLLLAIARLDEGVGARLLRDIGAPPARVREEVARRLGVEPGWLAPPPRRRARLLRRS